MYLTITPKKEVMGVNFHSKKVQQLFIRMHNNKYQKYLKFLIEFFHKFCMCYDVVTGAERY